MFTRSLPKTFELAAMLFVVLTMAWAPTVSGMLLMVCKTDLYDVILDSLSSLDFLLLLQLALISTSEEVCCVPVGEKRPDATSVESTGGTATVLIE